LRSAYSPAGELLSLGRRLRGIAKTHIRKLLDCLKTAKARNNTPKNNCLRLILLGGKLKGKDLQIDWFRLVFDCRGEECVGSTSA